MLLQTQIDKNKKNSQDLPAVWDTFNVETLTFKQNNILLEM